MSWPSKEQSQSGWNREECRKCTSSAQEKFSGKHSFLKFFFKLLSQNESATDFHMRVWCLKTKCNVSEQFRSLHWSTSQLQYLLLLCWQKKVSFVLILTALYIVWYLLCIHLLLVKLALQRVISLRYVSFLISKLDLFSSRTEYCLIHQRKEICLFKLGILT